MTSPGKPTMEIPRSFADRERHTFADISAVAHLREITENLTIIKKSTSMVHLRFSLGLNQRTKEQRTFLSICSRDCDWEDLNKRWIQQPATTLSFRLALESTRMLMAYPCPWRLLQHPTARKCSRSRSQNWNSKIPCRIQHLPSPNSGEP